MSITSRFATAKMPPFMLNLTALSWKEREVSFTLEDGWKPPWLVLGCDLQANSFQTGVSVILTSLCIASILNSLPQAISEWPAYNPSYAANKLPQIYMKPNLTCSVTLRRYL